MMYKYSYLLCRCGYVFCVNNWVEVIKNMPMRDKKYSLNAIFADYGNDGDNR